MVIKNFFLHFKQMTFLQYRLIVDDCLRASLAPVWYVGQKRKIQQIKDWQTVNDT